MDAEVNRDPRGSGRRTRQSRLSARVLDVVWRRPGLLQKDIFRTLGEKDILVLSVLDELIRDGAIVRRDEPARIYPAGAETPAPQNVTVESPAETTADTESGRRGNSSRALALIRIHRMLTDDLGLEVYFNEHLTAFYDGRELIRVEVFPSGLIVKIARELEIPKDRFPGLPIIELDGGTTLGPVNAGHLSLLKSFFLEMVRLER